MKTFSISTPTGTATVIMTHNPDPTKDNWVLVVIDKNGRSLLNKTHLSWAKGQQFYLAKNGVLICHDIGYTNTSTPGMDLLPKILHICGIISTADIIDKTMSTEKPSSESETQLINSKIAKQSKKSTPTVLPVANSRVVNGMLMMTPMVPTTVDQMPETLQSIGNALLKLVTTRLLFLKSNQTPGKITGMLLELPDCENLITDTFALNAKVTEAIEVLVAYRATQDARAMQDALAFFA